MDVGSYDSEDTCDVSIQAMESIYLDFSFLDDGDIDGANTWSSCATKSVQSGYDVAKPHDSCPSNHNNISLPQYVSSPKSATTGSTSLLSKVRVDTDDYTSYTSFPPSGRLQHALLHSSRFSPLSSPSPSPSECYATSPISTTGSKSIHKMSSSIDCCPSPTNTTATIVEPQQPLCHSFMYQQWNTNVKEKEISDLHRNAHSPNALSFQQTESTVCLSNASHSNTLNFPPGTSSRGSDLWNPNKYKVQQQQQQQGIDTTSTIEQNTCWCTEATARIMISAEVHGKLLMRLRDYRPKMVSQQQQQHRHHHHHRHHHRFHRKNYNCPKQKQYSLDPLPPTFVDDGNVSWMRHTSILQYVPKLLRIIIKTASYYCELHEPKCDGTSSNTSKNRRSGNNNNSHSHNLQQILDNHNITSHNIYDVLKHVSGICTMTVPVSQRCVDRADNCTIEYYYSLDQAWLMSYLNPKIYGYTPAVVGSNIVLLIIEQRILHLIDNANTDEYHSTDAFDVVNEFEDGYGKCYYRGNNNENYCRCTNEICRIYELTYHEPLLFKPLGYKHMKDLVFHLPSIERIYDVHTVGPNGNRWCLKRVTLTDTATPQHQEINPLLSLY